MRHWRLWRMMWAVLSAAMYLSRMHMHKEFGFEQCTDRLGPKSEDAGDDHSMMLEWCMVTTAALQQQYPCGDMRVGGSPGQNPPEARLACLALQHQEAKHIDPFCNRAQMPSTGARHTSSVKQTCMCSSPLFFIPSRHSNPPKQAGVWSTVAHTVPAFLRSVATLPHSMSFCLALFLDAVITHWLVRSALRFCTTRIVPGEYRRRLSASRLSARACRPTLSARVLEAVPTWHRPARARLHLTPHSPVPCIRRSWVLLWILVLQVKFCCSVANPNSPTDAPPPLAGQSMPRAPVRAYGAMAERLSQSANGLSKGPKPESFEMVARTIGVSYMTPLVCPYSFFVGQGPSPPHRSHMPPPTFSMSPGTAADCTPCVFRS